MPQPSTALLIAGMHRSGTSFLGESCRALAFTLPRDAGGPARDNPRGHFEPRAVVALNDAILSERGAFWLRIGPLDLPAPDEALLARMDAAVAESFGDASHIIVKDPRLSLTLPLWRNWLDARGIQAAVLIALRDPREVAHSLARRNGFGADAAMLSWMNHTLGAIEGSEGLPRQLVLFPDWTRDPALTLARIAGLFRDVPADEAASLVAQAFLPEAVHGRGEAAASERPVEQLALDLSAFLAGAAGRGEVPGAAELATYRDRLAALSGAARAVEDAHAGQILSAQAAIAALDRGRAQLERNVADRLADAEAMAERVRATEAQRDEGIGLLSEQLQATEAQRDEAVACLRSVEAQQNEARNRALTLQAQLAATEAQRDKMTDLAETRWATIEELQDHAAQLQAHLQATEQTLAETSAWLERERNTVLKPIYRRLYRLGGRSMRRVLPGAAVERLKRRLPVPGGIPRALAFSPMQAPPAATRGYASVPGREGDKPDIFVLSIINWDFRIQRPQHLATRMAAEGHRVFFIEMEQNPREGTVREVAPGVHVVRLPNRGMRGLQSYTGVPTPAQTRAWIDHFHALADAVAASPIAHVVIEHSYWWNLAKHLSPEYQITFDCMDDIGGFSNTEPHVLDAELDMIARADKMVVSSQYLFDKFSPMRDVVMVRNGTDVSHFIDDSQTQAPGWLAGKLRPGAIRVGYVGAIAEWFHTDLLETVARANPDFDIHLCGAVTAEPPLRLGNLPNVTLHGEIPYGDVPAFHRQMDVLIIPFQLLPIIKACDPVKFYEYSAVMRPTVSTSLPELDRAGDLVFRADDAASFAAQIRRAAPLAQDADFGRRLRQYALDNAWSFRAVDMLAEMRREPKLSVVVLHYGTDTDMTLATLHAMLGRGEIYPNLEVVLVDNGSTLEVLDILRDRAAQDDRIVLVENGENLGFARGNNRGIEAATGEFVLLLNNDTFLAPGALLAMVRHLQRHPEIGIVGPMTNNIGNEARIEIAYADMEDMLRAARDLATGHRGQWTPIPVCAYFCAMFRRADLDRLGHLPEIYGRGMFEDDDHCATFRQAGLVTALAEDAFCHHHLSASFDALPSGEKQQLFERNRALFEDRWGKWVPHRYRDARPPASLPGAR